MAILFALHPGDLVGDPGGILLLVGWLVVIGAIASMSIYVLLQIIGWKGEEANLKGNPEHDDTDNGKNI